MLQKYQKTITAIATTLGVLSLLWSLWVTLYSFIDPVGPMFLYFTIPFVFVSFLFSHHGRLIVKIFCALFVLSHCLAFWTVNQIQDQSSQIEPVKAGIFIQCSNAMFEGVIDKQIQLTPQQKSDFSVCVNQ